MIQYGQVSTDVSYVCFVNQICSGDTEPSFEMALTQQQCDMNNEQTSSWL